MYRKNVRIEEDIKWCFIECSNNSWILKYHILCGGFNDNICKRILIKKIILYKSYCISIEVGEIYMNRIFNKFKYLRKQTENSITAQMHRKERLSNGEYFLVSTYRWNCNKIDSNGWHKTCKDGMWIWIIY